MYAATPPQAALTIERALAFSFQARISPSTRIAPIKIGTSQSEAWSCRARSSPLKVSFAPAQLTCSHGRKKQTRPIRAALRLIRRNTLLSLNARAHQPATTPSGMTPSRNGEHNLRARDNGRMPGLVHAAFALLFGW